jgi:hypothetical protein
MWSTTNNLSVTYKVLNSGNSATDLPLSLWIGQGIEQGSVVADPCVTIDNKQMITCPSSRAYDNGFTPLATDIGLIP